MNIGFLLYCHNNYGGVATWVKTLLPALAKNHTIRLGILNEKFDKPQLDDSIELFSGVGGCRKVAWRSDALVIWHLGNKVSSIFNDTPKPPTISVSHQGKDCAETLQAMSYQEPYSSKYVYVSPHAVCSIPKHLQPRSVCISNSLDLSHLSKGDISIRNMLRIEKDQIMISAMSRIHKEKSLHSIAQSVKMLGDKFKFVVSGRCCDFKYKKVLSDLGVILLSPSSNKQLLFESDFTISASNSEGNSYALIESLLAEIPTISTRVGLLETYPELVKITDGSVPDIIKCLKEDIADPEERTNRTKRSKQWLDQNLNFDSFVKKWEDEIYDLVRAN
jgi:glycosyltransferase involved in cell wall biosynthesis